MARNKSGQGKMQIERWLKDEKVPEYVTMRKETVDLSIRSWLCSTQVGSSSAVNLRLRCEPLRDRVDQPDIRRYISIQFNSIQCYLLYLGIHKCHVGLDVFYTDISVRSKCPRGIWAVTNSHGSVNEITNIYHGSVNEITNIYHLTSLSCPFRPILYHFVNFC